MTPCTKYHILSNALWEGPHIFFCPGLSVLKFEPKHSFAYNESAAIIQTVVSDGWHCESSLHAFGFIISALWE